MNLSETAMPLFPCLAGRLHGFPGSRFRFHSQIASSRSQIFCDLTHHNLDHLLDEYIEAAGIAGDDNGYLFRTAAGKTGRLTDKPLRQQDACRIVERRAKAAGIQTRIGNHTFRATGITAYLKNSGKLEVAQQIANHESPRTTKLYDRRHDEISLDEIEKISV